MEGLTEYESLKQHVLGNINYDSLFNILYLYKISRHVYRTHVTHLPFVILFSRITGFYKINNHVSRNKLSSTKFLWLVCYPQKCQNHVLLKLRYFTAQHKILTKCYFVKFDKQLLEG